MRPVLTTLLFLVSAIPAAADAPAGIGTLVSADTEVSGGRQGVEQPLDQGSAVYSNDRILTNASGVGQIEFVDHTKLAIGPGSTLTLDRFVYDPDKGKTDIVIGFGKGAFRFITGAGTHEGYELVTPVATISVRGTAFDVAIDDSGDIAVAMISGAVEVCSTRTLLCRTHNAVGQFLNMTSDGVFTLRDKWDATVMQGAGFAQAMPFMVNDNVLQPAFRAGTTIAKQYASLATDALNAAGQAVGQAATNTGKVVGQAANTAGQAAGKAAQVPAQILKNAPGALKSLNPFRR